MFDLRRREFITLLGGAAVTLPVAARAQQAGMPVLGFLGSASQASYTATQAAVHKGLNEAGYVEKQNLLVEYRWANFQYERLPALAAELARRPVDAIFATGSVTVAADGFEWQGRTYASLSAIARAITGTAWSGPRFFALRLNGSLRGPITRKVCVEAAMALTVRER